MIYPGDIYPILCSIIRADGAAPTVTNAPQITILNPVTEAVLVNNQNMTLVTGTQAVYRYAWNTAGVANGRYLAVVSYVADGVTVNFRFLEAISVGDTRITGPVALDSTVAKDATVAKAANVLTKTDYVAPDNSALIRQISARVSSIPTNLPSADLYQTVLSLLTDIHDRELGNVVFDRAQNTLTCYRIDGSVLQVFNTGNSGSTTTRTRA